ncbi:MAG: DEAD/DEAH box helicase [Paludibacteraceae bacterium]|nr:DEAD/DEAH box helicase [Paludibacteraceae bacterium]
MAQGFGQTWWGQEWLKALTHIDYENRIPRGATYARKGAVTSIKIKDNVIDARVQGSRRTPYKVAIVVPTFSKEQVERLIQELMRQPAIISNLLNRQLNPEIHTICKRIGISVFPTRWDDLDMHCSCPDWAVPCKHLAAVVYMMSREIDNDPFMVFKIHGVDLLQELQRRGIGVSEEAVSGVTMTKDVLHTMTAKEEKECEVQEPHRIDFSHLNNIVEPLCNLLTEKPAFYTHGDFRDCYAKEMARIARNASRILEGKEALKIAGERLKTERPVSYLQKSYQVELEIDEDLEVRHWFKGADLIGQPALSEEEFVEALMNIDEDYLLDYDRTVVAMHQALQCALQLAANGSIIPQIVKNSSDEYIVRWLPAVIDAETKRVVEALEKIMPTDLPVFSKKGAKTSKALKNRAECVVSYMLGMLIPTWTSKSGGDSVKSLFFNGTIEDFDEAGEKSIPIGIASWLDRLYISQRQFTPSLVISEDGEGFSLEIEVSAGGKPVGLHDFLTSRQFENKRFEALKELSLLTPFIRGLEQHINTEAKRPIYFTQGEFVPFLLDVLPAIRLLGVKVLLPQSLKKLIRPKVSVRLGKKQTDGSSYLRLDDMLRFDWQVALGDELITPEEFLKLARNASGLIRYKQQYIYMSEADIKRLSKALSESPLLSRTQLLQAALTESYDGAHIELTDEARQLIRQLTEQTEVAVPQSVNATLRPYQERGYAWMYRNMRIGFGSVIADDMGLGKTLQVITLLQRIKDDGLLDKKHALIVVPTGLITNWQAELRRFAPGLTVFTYHGSQRSLKEFDADILLTTYGVMRSDAVSLKKQKWQVVVIDEAQNIKNADTAQSKAIRNIPADNYIAMSGTPVENRLSEFWSIMDFVNRGYLDTLPKFKTMYASPIQQQGDERIAERFRKITAPFLLRRLKTDKSIINDLPDKIEQNELAVLTEQQAALYHETLEHAMKTIEGVEGDDPQSLFKRQGLVLQMILALKQISNHPALFLKNGDWQAEMSGKTEMLLSLLESIVASGQKVLVFTQFKEMGEILQKMIGDKLGEMPMFLHGGCSIKQRQAMVERFQSNRHTDHIFLLSLKAAGTGLNLTAASHVIHFDLWWNPAVEAQATDRAYRIGQHQNVLVHRFITQNTFEEKIDEMIQDKRHLADMTVATGENWIGRLSNAELRELFG